MNRIVGWLRGREPLPLALTALTVLSGLIDAVCYLGLGHVFTANMTGNLVVLGFALAGAPGFSAGSSAIALGAFLLGAIGSGRLARAMADRPEHQCLLVELGLEALLVGVATVLAAVVDLGSGAKFAVIAVLALAMGGRNGTVGRLAVPGMTTTVLTRTLAGLAADSWLAGGHNEGATHRVASVLCLLAGAIVGAWLVLHVGLVWPLLAVTVCLVVTALGYAGHVRLRQPA